MEILILLLGLLFVIWFTYILVDHPSVICVFFIFMLVYRTNINLPGPLDARGLITILLFVRLVFDKENFKSLMETLFANRNFLIVLLFLVVSFFVTYLNFGGLKDLLKSTILNIISIILGFLILRREDGQKILVYALLLTGIMSSLDLIYSFLITGQLRVTRLINLAMGDSSAMNHNFPGLLCGIALVYTFYLYITKAYNRYILYSLILLFSISILISTSRSTLMGVFIVTLVLFFVQKEVEISIQKVISTCLIVLFSLTTFYFTYNFLETKANLKSTFVKQIYWRLFEEPANLFGEEKVRYNKFTGNRIEGTMSWRLKKATKDITNFSEKDLTVKLFGLGIDGYTLTKFGGGRLNAHNGYVLLIIERGIVGFLLFVGIFFGLSGRVLYLIKKDRLNAEIVYLLLFILFYAIGQNAELTSPLAFFLIGAITLNLTNQKKMEVANL